MLSAITSLKKLCNHPKLIYDAVNSPANADKEGAAVGEVAAGFKVRGRRGAGGMEATGP